MTRLGLPVPPGFTLTTEVWKSFDQAGTLSPEIWQETLSQLQVIERETGRTFGSKGNPLIVSIRSGARYSMPGMMDTILNVGINSNTLAGLVDRIGEKEAGDAYQTLEEEFNTIIGRELPQDVHEQLIVSIKAILNSWDNPRAVTYRLYTGIPRTGTAVTIQEMVFGNMHDRRSGAGIFFTRNPHTGRRGIWGEFALASQGTAVVSGRGKTVDLTAQPFYPVLRRYGTRLEQHFRYPQDVEFTVERGKVWLLQTRKAKLSPKANIVVADELWREKLISYEDALHFVTQDQVKILISPSFDQAAEEKARSKALVSRGKSASPYIAVGYLATTADMAKNLLKRNRPAILVVDYFDPNDIELVFSTKGIATRIGGTASHMALTMQAKGLPGIVGCGDITILPGRGISYNGKKLMEGRKISMDATTGEIFTGWLPQKRLPTLSHREKAFLAERRKYFGESAWATALYPMEALHRRADFLQRIQKVVIPEIAKWNSPKAIETIALNTLLPPEDIIQSQILDPANVTDIERAIRGVYEKDGYEAIPRSVHTRENLGKEPWTNVPEHAVGEFMHNPNYIGNPSHPEYGGLPRWKENPHLVGITIPAEPMGKMDEDLYPRHFAFTVKCLDTQPPKILVDISLGNPHLREIDKIPPEKLIEITALLNPETPHHIGQINYDFGRDNFDHTNMEELLRVLRGGQMANTVVGQILDLMRQRYPTEALKGTDTNTIMKITSRLIKSGLLTEQMYQTLVNKRAWLITQLVANTVFKEWWLPPMALPHVMSALADTFGFSVLEGQGRMEEDGYVPWQPKVYGLKGAQELASVMDKLLKKAK